MEFEDYGAFKRWLEKQSQQVCVAIAARAALRVWPVLLMGQLELPGQKIPREKKSLLSARAILLASQFVITGKRPVKRVQQLADLRQDFAKSDDAARAAQEAAFGLFLDSPHAWGNSSFRAVMSSFSSESAASDVFNYTRKSTYADASLAPELMLSTPLWHWAGWPEGQSPVDFGPFHLDTDPRFDFFKRWYDGMVRGEPLDWELQRRVALISPETWEAGTDAVAEAIAEIEAQYLLEQAPLAERVEFNEDSNRFRVVPIPMQNAAFMSALMSRTADALDDALHGNNGLREDMREVRVLRRTHDRYSNDPQRVEMDYASVAVALRRNLDSKELADSEDNLALLEAVEEGARGLRAHHPEVAANRASLVKQAIRELPPEEVALLEDAQEVLPEITEGVMQEDFARDIPKLINDATLPLPTGAPPLPGADETTRIFSRVSRMRLLYDKASDKGAATFDSKGFKTVRLGLTVSRMLNALVTLGLRLFGVL